MKKIEETYTRQEVEELEAWFDKAALPASLQVDKATFVPNVADTVTRLFKQAYLCYENPKLLGGLHLLERIKAKLEEENKENADGKNE